MVAHPVKKITPQHNAVANTLEKFIGKNFKIKILLFRLFGCAPFLSSGYWPPLLYIVKNVMLMTDINNEK